MMIPKYQNAGVLGWFGNVKNKVMGAFNKPSIPSAIEQKYINMTPPVKYNPQTPNVPGPVNLPKFSFKNLMGGLTSINAAPMAITGVALTPDTVETQQFLEEKYAPYRELAESSAKNIKSVINSPKSTERKFVWDDRMQGDLPKGLSKDEFYKKYGEFFGKNTLGYGYNFNFGDLQKATEQAWNNYVTNGYDKIKSNISTAPVNEWETKYNDLNTRYQELQKQIEELRKPITPQEVSPTPTPTQVETPQLTQNKIRLANTEAFLNNSRNPGWRRRYREGLNTALRNGDLYNVYTGQGNQSFDMAGLSMGDLLSTQEGLRYFDPVKGFTRSGIRRLAKDYRKGRIGTSIGQALSNFIGQSSNGSPAQTNIAPPEDWVHNYGVQRLGINPVIIGPQPVDTGEPDVPKKVVV